MIDKNVCSRLNVRVDGAHATLAANGLRVTIVSLLLNAGYSDAIITLRTGHRDIASLQHYHNFRGRIGLGQLPNMFSGSTDGEKPVASSNLGDVSLRRAISETVLEGHYSIGRAKRSTKWPALIDSNIYLVL